MAGVIEPNQWVAFKLPSGSTKIVQVLPDTTISLGKYGSFPSNLLIHRPFHLTYEIQDKRDGENFCRLRIVSAQELRADDTLTDTKPREASAEESNGDAASPSGAGEEFSLVDKESGKVIARASKKILDEKSRQLLTAAQIEELKQDDKTLAGKEIIDKLLASHQALDEKTEYSLEKYKLLKTKKYIRRFSVKPLDTPMLNHWLLEEKDAQKIMDMRQEMLALLGCWANVHHAAYDPDEGEPIATDLPLNIDAPSLTGGRWLVVDDTGGLLVAAMAERMGILYPKKPGSETQPSEVAEKLGTLDAENGEAKSKYSGGGIPEESEQANGAEIAADQKPKFKPRHYDRDDLQIPYVGNNTITLLHSNSQPNLTFLKYYDFDFANPNPPFATHPLHSNLIWLNWLQLLAPEEDSIYTNEPAEVSADDLYAWKANRRGVYHRKRRRWARTRFVVDSTRAGCFAGLVVASTMDPVSILRYTVPLLSPGAPIAIYSQSIEPLIKLADCYSVARRAAWANNPPEEAKGLLATELERWPGSEDFPLNPSLLLGASVQTSRVRRWQVLPGRTHPLMTGRGGSEGYIFTAWKALPATGRVEARGKYKKRKVAS